VNPVVQAHQQQQVAPTAPTVNPLEEYHLEETLQASFEQQHHQQEQQQQLRRSKRRRVIKTPNH